jgi:hypothetical protein
VKRRAAGAAAAAVCCHTFLAAPPIWEAKLRELQQPAHLVAHLVVMAQLHRDNRYDRMTDSFKELVGHAPMSAAEFARRHAVAFTPG